MSPDVRVDRDAIDAMLETGKGPAQSLGLIKNRWDFLILKMAEEEKQGESEHKGVIPFFASFQEYLSSDQGIREVRLAAQDLLCLAWP